MTLLNMVVLDGEPLDSGDGRFTELAMLGELTVHEATKPEEIVERCAGAQVIFTNKVRLDAATFAALPALRLVVVLATGYDVVDVKAARARGVPVCNVPEYGTEAVAQHALALMLELARHAGLHDRAVRAGDWARAGQFSFWHTPQIELTGLTLGIVGLGRIGTRTAGLARAFGMRVVATASRARPGPGWPDFAWLTVDELFATADFVSLHCPVTEATRHLVDERRLARMKRGAYLVNTARGALVDEAALAAALHSGHLGGAALDVVSVEPIRPDNPLLSAPRCVLTPHLAWATSAARARLTAGVVGAVRAWLAGKPINVVN